MKKILVLILALTMMVGVASAELKVAFSQIGQESDWRTANTDDAYKLLGVEYDSRDYHAAVLLLRVEDKLVPEQTF